MALMQDTRPGAGATPGGCPVNHHGPDERKAARSIDLDAAPLTCDAEGTWHVRGFDEARAILRSNATRQAGFNAELVTRTSVTGNLPVLYQEGKDHQEQRKQTARFFTPKTVSTSYQKLMQTLADGLVADLQRTRRADLSQMSLTLAVQVAGQVVGLTDSRLPGMAGRLAAFFRLTRLPERETLASRLQQLVSARHLLAFYWLDVRPAIRARRRRPQDDVISHLLAHHYNEREILTECVTYAAAGMVTTREFISMAAWHFLERPALRARYLVAGEEGRQAMLHEVLRLEPIVAELSRRATADIPLTSRGTLVVIPAGALIRLHIDTVNADAAVTGADPLALCPGRPIQSDRVGPMLLSFGDGAHRCPGAYIAIQETDIFLQRLLALETLRIAKPPALTWNALTTGYDLRQFVLALDPVA